MKVCKHCGIEKEHSEYNKAGGGKWLQPYCKPCDSVRKKKYSEQNAEKVRASKKVYYENNKEFVLMKTRRYVEINKEAIKQKKKKYYDANREQKRGRDREYRKINGAKIDLKLRQKRKNNPDWYQSRLKKFKESRTPEQKERNRVQQAKWRKENKDKIKAQRQLPQVKERRRIKNRELARIKSATDISFRIVKNLRSRIGFALKRGIKKSATTKELLGCSIDFFKQYFQSLFTEGMTWDLFMSADIHIDHIKPCKEFDLVKPEEQRRCFHYTNLQPLWWYDNLKKGANYQEQKAA